jgi:forkhead transcription factor HCM1
MAKFTRFDPFEPLTIFQDENFENPSMISHAPMPPAAKTTRRPLSGNQENVIFNPPNVSSIRHSPVKPATRRPAAAPLATLKQSQTAKLNMVSFKPPTQSKPAEAPRKQPLMSRFKTVAQKPTVDSGFAQMGKENAHPLIFPSPTAFNLNIENYYQKPPNKRLLEPAPISTRPQKKQKLDEIAEGPLPPHNAFPTIVDDGTKPGHSYAMLIGMAILRSPHRRLTLSQIYKWISDTYSFYNPQDAGWQNSIRHNLSLNKAFVKQERPKDDPGKGNYWAIEPGMEQQFMKEKGSRNAKPSVENIPVTSMVLETAIPLAVPEPVLPPLLPPQAHPSSSMLDSSGLLQPEVSSDATIPVSDNPPTEESLEKPLDSELTLDVNLYSPLPAAMHSSPPIPRILEHDSGTPPRAYRHTGSSATRSHKRKFASMDDSGYISSLESSVLRHDRGSCLPPSEADRPRIKRGRAEEEIARLRASSYDSPTKGRSYGGFAPPSSSPLRPGLSPVRQRRQSEANQMLPPLTPAVKFKRPPKPPPSASPNTDLRLHRDRVRDMLASPLRRIPTNTESRQLWGSPALQKTAVKTALEALDYGFKPSLPSAGFDIFQDDVSSLFPSLEGVEVMTPEQPSVKRLRLERSHSTSVLGDVTNSAARRNYGGGSLNFLKLGHSPAAALDSPSKFLDALPSSPSRLFLNQSPTKLQIPLDDENAWISMDDLCNTDFLTEQDDFGGLDILQGFEKIGAANPPIKTSKAQKPPLGRSYTTTF